MVSIPLLAPQFVQFGFFGVRTGVFLQDIQLGGLNVEIAAPGVFDLHVVFHYMIDFHFFNTPVNPKAMVFVNHVIPHGQFREAVDLLAAVLGFLSLFLLLFLPEKYPSP